VAFYVGAPPLAEEQRRPQEAPRRIDLAASEIERLRGPVGLKIARRPHPRSPSRFSRDDGRASGVQIPETIEPRR